MLDLRNAFAGKRVLVTGHTGFKGSWLCEWLLKLDAEVFGYSLPPPTSPALFNQLGLAPRLHHQVGDIRDSDAVARAVDDAQPDYILHLAAQSLVRLSYVQPVETYATNVMGTVNILQALQGRSKPCAVVVVTTDKCYENREWLYGYREEDPLGGHDPYSSSKAAAEIAVASWRNSFFSAAKIVVGKAPPVGIATARAGNVIGGGDWALDRIVPDCVRALSQGAAIVVRNPRATRPWQHVLEPLGGYLLLGARLSAALTNASSSGPAAEELARLCGPFNFGPGLDSNRPVRDMVTEVLRSWPGKWDDHSSPDAVHEAQLLQLAVDKAHHVLGWRGRWNFSETVAKTISWYRECQTLAAPEDVRAVSQRQIMEYTHAQ